MSQYNNGEACGDCNCPADSHCRGCGFPMCKCCYKSNKGYCVFCRQTNKVVVTVTPGTMDDGYAHYENNPY